MDIRLYDNDDWLIGVRLVTRDPNTGLMVPVAVEGVPFTCTFTRARDRAIIGTASVWVADADQGRLFVALPRANRTNMRFDGQSLMSVLGQLQAADALALGTPVQSLLRTRGLISAVVEKLAP